MLFCWFAGDALWARSNFPSIKYQLIFFPLLLFLRRPLFVYFIALCALCFYLCSSEIKRHAINNNKRAHTAMYIHTYSAARSHSTFTSHFNRSLSSFIDPLWSNNNKKCCQTLLCDGRFVLRWRLMNCAAKVTLLSSPLHVCGALCTFLISI